MPDIGIVTCMELPEPDLDEQIQLEALQSVGAHASLVAWDDPDQDLAKYDAIVLRSCWDYPWKEQLFRQWIDRAENAVKIINPPEMVRWNLHKRYLIDLQDAGVPVVPTRLLPLGAGPEDLVRCLDDLSCQKFVIKPAVSAGSWLTHFFHVDDLLQAKEFISKNGSDRDWLIQPYISSVESGGERANVYLGGEWSHCVVKSPRFVGQDESVSESEMVLPEDMAIGQQAIDCAPGIPTYARADTVRDEQGQPMIAELELIEPSLFLLQSPPARALFAESCLRALKSDH
ncbi:hypothetical protein CBD41_07530 [bacterium TMED181]|nr:hypothetical protein [Planctomycetota bacterium]OUW43210.1 MAG: hypothetical protein CBD41_07530 [bacterium TMED181]